MANSTPPTPRTIEETGLEPGFLMDLLIKNVYRLAHELPTQMATAISLSPPLVEQLITLARDNRLMQTAGVRTASVTAEMRYGLTDAGKAWALDALRQSEYVGPAPVPLKQYYEQVKRQSIRGETITRSKLGNVLKKLTLAEAVKEAVGPAANSASSMLLYGPPGNGKSSIANAICAAFDDVVFIPHALELDRQIITMFDNTVHRPVPLATQDGGLRRTQGFDKRYVVCKRPVVITGGELTIDMLDLSYTAASGIYEAPLQLKASGGVFVIDDFGRQREQPQALINRWIIPLEGGVDFLTLQTGRKFEAPFDTLVIFSTNIPPKQLVDDAALRRIRHKIEIGKPDEETFLRILINSCNRHKIAINEETVAFMLSELYQKTRAEYAAFHAEFLIDQVKAICTYEEVPLELKPEYLKRAWGNLFTSA
ncbi:MAG: AAA family ATPase [Pseudomonadota bacterium]